VGQKDQEKQQGSKVRWPKVRCLTQASWVSLQDLLLVTECRNIVIGAKGMVASNVCALFSLGADYLSIPIEQEMVIGK
jgi:hypothetical protein